MKRREVRRSLRSWCELCGYTPAAHHRLLIEKLERVAQGKCKRLAIFLPPGSAKSTYGSVLFPPWFLSQPAKDGHHGTAILTASHSKDLSEAFGRRARNLVDQHQLVLGYRLTDDSKAAGRWNTTNGGSFITFGVGTGISGRRCDLGLIDDPIGKKEDADSKLMRDKTWDWYNFDFKPRLHPDAAIVLIQTRWHEDDLAGRILATEGSEWEVIRIPFHAEDDDPLGRAEGEMLWPEWFKEDMYPKDPRVAQCLYQNDPTPEQGNFFLAEWLVDYSSALELPPNLRNYVGSDHAVSKREEADLSCFVPAGIDSLDDLWVLPDIFWKRCDSGEAVEAMIDMASRRKPLAWFAEKGHITMSLGPFLTKRMQERSVYIPLFEQVSSKDKMTRAQSMRGRFRQKKVHLPKFVSCYATMRAEILSFPNGKHDDFVDALSEIGMGLEATFGAPSIKLEPTDDEILDSLNKPITFGSLRVAEKHKRSREKLLNKL
jgi:predicted phage terminase large subunit-like protein